jgi:DNA-directed RNA polymerase subunit RPC12/RpoP
MRFLSVLHRRASVYGWEMTRPVEEWSNDEILDALDEERRELQGRPVARELYIAILRDRGVYPQDTVEGNCNTVEKMVEWWGARWHIWTGLFACPHCGSEQRDLRTGPPFMRTIAVINRDRAEYYRCPDCQRRFELHEASAGSQVPAQA